MRTFRERDDLKHNALFEQVFLCLDDLGIQWINYRNRELKHAVMPASRRTAITTVQDLIIKLNRR